MGTAVLGMTGEETGFSLDTLCSSLGVLGLPWDWDALTAQVPPSFVARVGSSFHRCPHRERRMGVG